MDPMRGSPARNIAIITLAMIALIIANVALFIFWNPFTNAAPPSVPATEGDDEQPLDAPTDGTAQPPPRSPARDNIAQRDTTGAVAVQAAWDFERTTRTSIHLMVLMETHTVNLDNVDLSTLAVLRNDKGRQVTPAVWDAPPGGHHRSGTLVFSVDENDPPLIERETEYIELVISGVAGVPQRVLHWDLEAR